MIKEEEEKKGMKMDTDKRKKMGTDKRKKKEDK